METGQLMIKLIATIWMEHYLTGHEITTMNQEAIKFAQANGITVVIATGRAFYEAQTPVAETDLKSTYV